MRILVTRPLQDGEAIARRLAAMGHQALLAPLLTVQFLDGEPLDLAGVQAVLVTSANGVRALARRVTQRDIPIFAVGPQSAVAAKAEGFTRVRSADGDAATLANSVSGWAKPGEGFLLHGAGEDASAVLTETLSAQGFQTRRENLYRVEKSTHLSAEAAGAIRQGAVDAALFFSPNSAALFAECVARDSLSVDGVIAICISAKTRDALAGLKFAETRIAATPDQDALLSCL